MHHRLKMLLRPGLGQASSLTGTADHKDVLLIARHSAVFHLSSLLFYSIIGFHTQQIQYYGDYFISAQGLHSSSTARLVALHCVRAVAHLSTLRMFIVYNQTRSSW